MVKPNDEFSNLCRLYGSDKVDHHDFSPIYYNLLLPIKDRRLVVLELGSGGYYHRNIGGAGTRALRDFLPNSTIISVDIEDKPLLRKEDRIRFFQGSQTDTELLLRIIEEVGTPDIIIDDASHINPFTLLSFEILYPHLNGGGLYFLEDVHSSYWGMAADGTDFRGGDHEGTVMNYMKSLTDTMNYDHSGKKDIGIHSISFFRELIVVKKK